MEYFAEIVKLTKSEKNPINIESALQITNDTNAEVIIVKDIVGNDLSKEFLEDLAQRNINSIADRDAALSKTDLKLGPITPKLRDQTPQQQFSVAANNLARLKQRVALGLITENDVDGVSGGWKEFTEALALAQSLYQPGF